MASGTDGSTAPLAFRPVALATLDTRVPAGPEWVHEEKLDGYRIQALIEPARSPAVRLFSRNAKEWTHRFPKIVRALAQMPVQSLVLDGEVVAVVPRGASAFQALQRSMEAGTPGATPALRYCVFDVLQVDGTDTRDLPLRERQQLLALLLRHRPPRAPVRGVRRLSPARGDVLAQACAAGLEGIICKRLDARYVGGRHRSWLKVKCVKRQEFVVVGFTEPRGSRTGFGALLLGVHDATGVLRFAGKVGTGFDTAQLQSLRAALRTRETPAAPVTAPPAVPRTGVQWVRPDLVAEVAFTEWTADGVLRHPVFHGLRADKSARDVIREDVPS